VVVTTTIIPKTIATMAIVECSAIALLVIVVDVRYEVVPRIFQLKMRGGVSMVQPDQRRNSDVSRLACV
jgi:hypothetical protein